MHARAPPVRSDGDGVIYPWDTYNGFRKLGFGWIVSALAPVVIHGTFSLPTQVEQHIQVHAVANRARRSAGAVWAPWIACTDAGALEDREDAGCLPARPLH